MIPIDTRTDYDQTPTHYHQCVCGHAATVPARFVRGWVADETGPAEEEWEVTCPACGKTDTTGGLEDEQDEPRLSGRDIDYDVRTVAEQRELTGEV